VTSPISPQGVSQIEPATLSLADLAHLTATSAKQVAGSIGRSVPPPDAVVGRARRWRRSTVERWLRGEWRPSRLEGVSNES
jgi:hypothetical protein